MHHANHFYGHAHILAEYCGLDPDDPPRIDGFVQHGWNVVDGLGYGTPYVPGRPILVYSERTRRRAWSMGRRHVTVIGAPFLYLLTMRPEEADAPPREGTIFYPFHGWENQQVLGDHQRQVEEILETEDGPVTFCLYWNEFQNDKVRESYEQYGRVVCHGYRGKQWLDTDRFFLDKQLAELRRHKRVASNRLSSAIFHGVAAGCEPAVYGDPMHLDREDLPMAERIRREWPELHGKHLDMAVARPSALSELGDGYLASPDELRVILGWSAKARVPA
ncbi:hypothetical protein ACFY36_26225 [Actinoplanes sp. NPDC000266]